jgi:hypothetical protein
MNKYPINGITWSSLKCSPADTNIPWFSCVSHPSWPSTKRYSWEDKSCSRKFDGDSFMSLLIRMTEWGISWFFRKISNRYRRWILMNRTTSIKLCKRNYRCWSGFPGIRYQWTLWGWYLKGWTSISDVYRFSAKQSYSWDFTITWKKISREEKTL